MFNFASWMLNPWMLGAGALAVSIPIIIHLLNKRRFKIVDWAAMDFLFDADKKNRRRVRIENLILLLLRCAVMLLIGLMLARPFFDLPLGWLSSKQKVERIVLLDDSLSMKIVTDNKTALEQCKLELKNILATVATDDKDDTLTLYVTSQPDRPIISNEPITSETVDAVVRQLDDLEISQGRAQYEESLQNIERYISGQKQGVARVVYVFSDLRLSDWGDPSQTDPNESGPSQLLAKLSENELIAHSFVIDAGARNEENLAITDISSNTLQVANADVSYSVTVTNFGRRSAKNVRVRFRIGENAPQTDTIESIAPGASQSIDFRHRYNHELPSSSAASLEMDDEHNRLNYEISAEIVRDGSNDDFLNDDNEKFFPGNVLKGIPVLTVNGDPSSNLQSNETYMLNGLAEIDSGFSIDSVTVNQFLTTPLSKYKVIYLCNVDAFPEEQMKALEQWVSEGGGLVIMPGNRVRVAEFNNAFYKDGKGLSPVRLKGVSGDATKTTWVSASVADPNHPAVAQPLAAIQSSGLSVGALSIFSWWESEIPTDELKQITSVILRLTDKDQTPLMCERKFGEGRVISFAIPADADWCDWNSIPSFWVYVPLFNDLTLFLMAEAKESFAVPVGGSIEYPVELSRYETGVSLVDPNEEKMTATARPIDDTDEARQSLLYQTEFSGLRDRGFYRMSLMRKTGQTDDILFAVNVESDESDLKRLDVNGLNPSFFGENTKLVGVTDIARTSVSSSENEIWYQLLFVLLGVLAVEQFLGWWFGRKR